MGRIDAKKLAKAGHKYIGRPYTEMDCQKFVEQCMKDCGGTLDLPGSNAWFRKCNWVGSPEDCLRKFGRIPDGAFLFIVKDDGGEEARGYHDGKGNATHIGLKTGTGKGGIHSSSSRGFVDESEFHDKTIKNGGWNAIGLWTDGIDYGEDIDQKIKGGSDEGESGREDISPEPDQPVEESFNGIVCAEHGNSVKMRKKPSTTCNLYWEVPIGSMVEVLHDDPTWAKIRWSGRTGYMKREFIKSEEEAMNEPLPPDVKDEEEYLPASVWAPTGSTVKLRQKPSQSCPYYVKVPIGSSVIVTERGADWCTVNYGDHIGWYMMSKFLIID